MAETLLALLLVNSSAKGSNLVYRWPPSPASSTRLRRALPQEPFSPSHLDNPWRASHTDSTSEVLSVIPESEPSYEWRKPLPDYATRDFSTQQDGNHSTAAPLDEYEHTFGYSAEFLASILCPQSSMSHQKFELIVDDLAFIGHPVCADPDGQWRFKSDKAKGSRSRGSSDRQAEFTISESYSPDRGILDVPPESQDESWLTIFHFVVVLDLPDPSSSASGNILKYFDVIYEHVAFPVAAVLFQEQVLTNFVEQECDTLGSLKDSCVSKGESFHAFMMQALDVSSIAPAMKALYLAIKSSAMAYISINSIPLELQLPPFLDTLLHTGDDNDLDSPSDDEDEGRQGWGPEMGVGWKLPSLTPWKSLLLLDNDGFDPYMNLRGPHINSEDRMLVEGLLQFLETASVTVSLAKMADRLGWNLETQVFPAVRWLVLHRRAKVVDLVHHGLKTVFAVAPKIDRRLCDLADEFKRQFELSGVPPLPEILATISATQSQSHFFASVVKERDLIPLYQDVVLWMLKRDLLITLHLRIRLVVTPEVKERVKLGRGRARQGTTTWLSLSPKSARRYTQRISSNESSLSRLSELNLDEDDEEGGEEEEASEEDDAHVQEDGDDTVSSLINDPGRATSLERRWIAEMSEGKEPYIMWRFQQINRYFDGKKTDDEILFQAEITRKQLREVLHHYDEYLQTFMHPS